jgi:hypothetical protein
MKIPSQILFAGVLALSGSVGAVETAAAMPLVQPSNIGAAAPVENAGWRCGPGWRMNAWGRCVPNRPVYRRYWRRW